MIKTEPLDRDESKLQNLDPLPPLPEVPRARYIDEAFFQLEIDRVFKRSWLLAGHVCELPTTGSYRMLDIPFARIFLVRGKDDKLRAFIDSCRHRGSSVLRAKEGCVRNFVCPYHGWTYDLQGTLVGIPLPEMFPGFDKTTQSLFELRCELWGGFVFINFDSDGPALTDWLPNAVKRRYSAGTAILPDQPVRLANRMSWDLDCNWKLQHENFRESYHLEFMHRKTAMNTLNPYSAEFTIFERGHGGKNTAYRAADEKRSSWVSGLNPQVGTDWLRELATVQAMRSEGVFLSERVHNFFCFPQSSINFERYGYSLHQVWPVAVDKSRLVVTQYVVDWGDLPRPDLLDRMREGTEAIMQEDMSLMAHIQQGLLSHPHGGFKFGTQECLLYNLNMEIDRLIGVADIAENLRMPDQDVLGGFVKQ